jgi:hypothetical protein
MKEIKLIDFGMGGFKQLARPWLKWDFGKRNLRPI